MVGKIEPLIHYCIVKDGPAAGNKARTEVTSNQLQYGGVCDFCYQPVATLEDLVFHMYDELTKDDL